MAVPYLVLMTSAMLLAVTTTAMDPVRNRIVADAGAMTPASLAFDRTTKSVRTGGGTTTNTLKVERWDGHKWALVSINGRNPTGGERAEAEKLAAASPVPGYHRLAALLATATESVTDSQGRTVIKIPVLPAGTVRTDSSDISGHLKAEVVLSSRDDKPWAERVKVTAREPFKMNMLIKVLSFEQVSEYKLDADGRPRLDRQIADSAGTMFGFPGGEKSEITYAYR
ncbi:hypothetical protein GCM10011529_08920 [Polymorphobacter glacialis]|uniref:Uncharacterized protein n=1 Tax=Sandarakinorhabdus glacialis TaxID=1614636 RepID=A0A917E4Y1_9SPHN|nr:hypothetical protein [Polymorphobacter glacialis]GGE04790.1 hypothetical protein GCM10011529_08920 [Polymorphobacter glacialis]